MNLIEHTVTKVLSKPYFQYMWQVDVAAVSYGREMQTVVSFNKKEDAEKVKPGYKFEA